MLALERLVSLQSSEWLADSVEKSDSSLIIVDDDLVELSLKGRAGERTTWEREASTPKMSSK